MYYEEKLVLQGYALNTFILNKFSLNSITNDQLDAHGHHKKLKFNDLLFI